MSEKPGHDKHGLLSAPINDVLRRLTVPMIFGMVAILMFNLVDTFFISLLGTEALAAVSFTFPVTFAVNCITMGIGMGLSTCIGHLLGGGEHTNAARFSSHGLLLAVLLVTAASGIGLASITPLFSLLGASAELPLISQYMEVWYLAVPLLVIPMAGNSAIRATGDTKTPAKIMMLAGFINGCLDPLLIFGYGPFPELGIQGAAIASGISWGCALVGSLYVLITREKLLAWPRLSTLWSDWRQILTIGMPAGLSTALNPLSGAILMSMLASQGTASVAAYGAAQRIESLLLIVIMSLTSALTPVMAQNLGAGNHQRAFQALFTSMRFSIVFQLLIFIMMVPLSWPLSSLFSQDTQVQSQLWYYLLVVPGSYGLQGVLMLLVSSLNAMHKPLHALCWNILRLFVLLLPAAFIGAQINGTHGLFIGISLANVGCGVLAYCYALYLRREDIRLSIPS